MIIIGRVRVTQNIQDNRQKKETQFVYVEHMMQLTAHSAFIIIFFCSVTYCLQSFDFYAKYDFVLLLLYGKLESNRVSIDLAKWLECGLCERQYFFSSAIRRLIVVAALHVTSSIQVQFVWHVIYIYRRWESYITAHVCVRSTDRFMYTNFDHLFLSNAPLM